MTPGLGTRNWTKVNFPNGQLLASLTCFLHSQGKLAIGEKDYNYIFPLDRKYLLNYFWWFTIISSSSLSSSPTSPFLAWAVSVFCLPLSQFVNQSVIVVSLAMVGHFYESMPFGTPPWNPKYYLFKDWALKQLTRCQKSLTSHQWSGISRNSSMKIFFHLLCRYYHLHIHRYKYIRMYLSPNHTCGGIRTKTI